MKTHLFQVRFLLEKMGIYLLDDEFDGKRLRLILRGNGIEMLIYRRLRREFDYRFMTFCFKPLFFEWKRLLYDEFVKL